MMKEPQRDALIASKLKNDFQKLDSFDVVEKNEFWQRFKKHKHILSKGEQEKIVTAFSVSDDDYRKLLSVVSEVFEEDNIDCLANAQQKLDALSDTERKRMSIEILKKL